MRKLEPAKLQANNKYKTDQKLNPTITIKDNKCNTEKINDIRTDTEGKKEEMGKTKKQMCTTQINLALNLLSDKNRLLK